MSVERFMKAPCLELSEFLGFVSPVPMNVNSVVGLSFMKIWLAA